MFQARHTLAACALMLMAICTIPAELHAAEQLTLHQAYRTAIENNPNVKAGIAAIEAAKGRHIQSGLHPNPDAFFEAENFGGSDTRSGFDNAEYTLGLEQKIELGSKRTKRAHLASTEQDSAFYEATITAQTILARTRAAYMNLAIAQERFNLAKDRLSLANKTHKTVKRRINAGKSADIEHTKADLEVSSAEIAKRKAQNEMALAQTALANLMGRSDLQAHTSADIHDLQDVPDRAAMMQALEQTPMRTLSQIAVLRENAALDLARANAIPDPAFGLGVRRFEEDNGTAFLASVSIPLNLFDRNQGRIAEAKANLKAAKARQNAARLNLEKQAMELWQTMRNAKDEAQSYQDALLPSARKAFNQAESGFNRGAFTFLDLLDAQRTLFEARESHLSALTTYHQTKAHLDMLTGTYADFAAFGLDTTQNTQD